MNTTLTPDAITVSPITQYGTAGWTWTVSTVELDADTNDYAVVTTRYRTDAAGQGLWVEGTPVDRQVLGFTQLDLRCSVGTRRERVLALALDERRDSEQAMTWRQVYAARPRTPRP